MSREEQTETTVNVDTKVTRNDLSISPAETPEDADHRRWRDRLLVRVTVSFASVVFLIAVIAFFFGPPEQKAWAAATFTSMLTAAIGYTTGRNSK